MNTKLERLQAGQYIPGCRTHNRYVRAEYAENAWYISVGIPSMSAAELETLLDCPIRFAAVQLEDQLFFLFRFSDAPWVTAPFEPRVLSDAFPPGDSEAGVQMIFALIDSDSGVAQGVRIVPLGVNVSGHILHACRALLGRPYDRAESLRRQAALLRQYPTGEDLLQAEGRGAVFSLAQV